MRFTRFPLTPVFGRKSATLLLVFIVNFLGTSAFATGNPKPVARPVARLISSQTSHRQMPLPAKARLIGRTDAFLNPTSAANASPARLRVAAVAASGDERRAFDLINARRREKGQTPLAWDGELTRMARYHSQNMAQQDFFNHVDRDGLDMTGRAGVLGVQGWHALAENIAYNQGYADPVSFAVERWMYSVKHRENILNRQFTHAGVGIAKAADGRVFFTQVFMTR